MKIIVCDRCEKDITNLQSGYLSGVRDADDDLGNGTETERAQLCRSCYSKFRIWFREWMRVPFNRDVSAGRVRSRRKVKR